MQITDVNLCSLGILLSVSTHRRNTCTCLWLPHYLFWIFSQYFYRYFVNWCTMVSHANTSGEFLDSFYRYWTFCLQWVTYQIWVSLLSILFDIWQSCGQWLSEYNSIFLSLAYFLYALVMELYDWYNCSLISSRINFPGPGPWSYL
jgi:hypothetical protein